MRKTVILLAMIFVSMLATAQNAKFGKPSKEEWDLKSVSYAPDAEAVVLYKSVDVTYRLSGAFNASGSGGEGSLDEVGFGQMGTNKYVSPEGCNMLYDVKVRTKILNDSGLGYASVDILTLNDKDDMNTSDEFYEMNATVFRNVDGKVKKIRVAKANITDERVDNYYVIRHVRIPEAQAGDIIEYQYQLFSNRITYIYDTQLQENIPVLYSKCRLEIPYFLQFNVNKPEIQNVSANVTLGSILMKSPNNDRQMPRKISSNVYTIEARNLPKYDGTLDLQNLTTGRVYCVRTELKDKRYDVKPEVSGPVRHLIIGK